MAAALANVTLLFFDVFGTTVAQRGPVADALFSAAQVVLESNVSTVNPDILEKAKDMTYDQWFDIGGTWFSDVNLFTKGIENVTDDVPWRSVDGFRITDLRTILENEGLVILREEGNDTVVVEGSLFNQTELENLGLVWHRLPPWPDTNHGLRLLNKKYNTSGLSNTYQDLLDELVMHGRIPLEYNLTSEEFHSFKPRRAVYLRAAAALGVQPEQCALVAAHLEDLQGAKSVGFHTIYVERPLEELNPELFNQGIQDLQVNMDQEGFITLAKLLGIQDD